MAEVSIGEALKAISEKQQVKKRRTGLADRRCMGKDYGENHSEIH